MVGLSCYIVCRVQLVTCKWHYNYRGTKVYVFINSSVFIQATMMPGTWLIILTQADNHVQVQSEPVMISCDARFSRRFDEFDWKSSVCLWSGRNRLLTFIQCIVDRPCARYKSMRFGQSVFSVRVDANPIPRQQDSSRFEGDFYAIEI